MPHKIDWGHSIYTDALSLSLKSNAKAFALFIMNLHEKNDILSMGDDCKKIAPSMNTMVAEEGLSIDLLVNNYPANVRIIPVYFISIKYQPIFILLKICMDKKII